MRRKYAIYSISQDQAKKIVKKLTKLARNILNDYKYISFGFSDLSEDGYEGITFEVMYSNEFIYNIEYKSTLKNLKNNNNFKVKNEKDEDYFLLLIEQGSSLPCSVFE